MSCGASPPCRGRSAALRTTADGGRRPAMRRLACSSRFGRDTRSERRRRTRQSGRRPGRSRQRHHAGAGVRALRRCRPRARYGGREAHVAASAREWLSPYPLVLLTAPGARASIWWRFRNAPHQNALSSIQSAHQPSPLGAPRATAMTASRTPSRNANTSFDRQRPNSRRAIHGRALRPAPPGPATSTSRGQQQIEEAASRRSEQAKRDRSRTAGASRAAPIDDQHQPADARPGPTVVRNSASDAPGPCSSWRRSLPQSARSSEPSSLIEFRAGPFGGKRKEQRRRSSGLRAAVARSRATALRVAPGRHARQPRQLRFGAARASAIRCSAGGTQARVRERDGSRHQPTSPNSR